MGTITATRKPNGEVDIAWTGLSTTSNSIYRWEYGTLWADRVWVATVSTTDGSTTDTLPNTAWYSYASNDSVQSEYLSQGNAWARNSVEVGVDGVDVTDRLLGPVDVTQWADSGSAVSSPGSCTLRLDNSDGLVDGMIPNASLVRIDHRATVTDPFVQSRSFENGLIPGAVQPVTGTFEDLWSDAPFWSTFIGTIRPASAAAAASLITTYVEPGTTHSDLTWEGTPAAAVAGDQWKLVWNFVSELIEYKPGESVPASTTQNGVSIPADWEQIPWTDVTRTNTFADYHDEILLTTPSNTKASVGSRSLRITFTTDRSDQTVDANNLWTAFDLRFDLTATEIAAIEAATLEYVSFGLGYMAETVRGWPTSQTLEFWAAPREYLYDLPYLHNEPSDATAWLPEHDFYAYTAQSHDPDIYPWGSPGSMVFRVEDGKAVFRLYFRNWGIGDILWLDKVYFDIHTGTAPDPPTVATYVDPAYTGSTSDATEVFTGYVKSVRYDWTIDAQQSATVHAVDLMSLWGSSTFASIIDRLHQPEQSDQWDNEWLWLESYYPMVGDSLSQITESTAGSGSASLRWRSPGSASSAMVSFDAAGVDGRKAVHLSPSDSDNGWYLAKGGVGCEALSVFFKTSSPSGTLLGIYSNPGTGPRWARLQLVDGVVTLEVDDGAGTPTNTVETTGVYCADSRWHHALLVYLTDTEEWAAYIDGVSEATVSTTAMVSGLPYIGGAYPYIYDPTEYDLVSDLTLSCLSIWDDMSPDWAPLFAERMAIFGAEGYTVLPSKALEVLDALAPDRAPAVTYTDAGRMDLDLSGAQGSLADITSSVAVSSQGRVFIDGSGEVVFRSTRAVYDGTPEDVGLDILERPPTIEWDDRLQAETGTIAQVSWANSARPVVVDLGAGSVHVVSLDTLCKDSVDAWQVGAASITSAWPARATIRQVTLDLLRVQDPAAYLALGPGDLLSLSGFPASVPTVDTVYTVEGRNLTIGTDGLLATFHLAAFRATDEFVLDTDDLSGAHGLRL